MLVLPRVVVVIVLVALVAEIEQIGQPTAATAAAITAAVPSPLLRPPIVGVGKVVIIEAVPTVAIATKAAAITPGPAVADAVADARRRKLDTVGSSVEEGAVRRALSRADGGVVDVGGGVSLLVVVIVSAAKGRKLQARVGRQDDADAGCRCDEGRDARGGGGGTDKEKRGHERSAHACMWHAGLSTCGTCMASVSASTSARRRRHGSHTRNCEN